MIIFKIILKSYFSFLYSKLALHFVPSKTLSVWRISKLLDYRRFRKPPKVPLDEQKMLNRWHMCLFNLATYPHGNEFNDTFFIDDFHIYLDS